MATFKDYMIGIILAGIFMIMFINFSVVLAKNNNANITALNNKDFNISEIFEDVNSSLGDFESTTKGSYNSTKDDIPQTATETFGLLTIPKAIINARDSVRVISNSILGLLNKVGVNKFVVNIFFAIIVFTLIFLGWKTIRSGD